MGTTFKNVASVEKAQIIGFFLVYAILVIWPMFQFSFFPQIKEVTMATVIASI